MGKEEIFKYLRNSKIQNELLKEICFYFIKDYTAIQTAQKLNLSRQTINNYYKIIRNILIYEENDLISISKSILKFEHSFSIKHIIVSQQVYYYIEIDKKIFLLDSNNTIFKNIESFIDKEVNPILLNKGKNNSIQVIFNKKRSNYLILKVYNSSNDFQKFINNRLKKFRGINKQNISLHIKESQIRYNYTESSLYKNLISLLDFNNKASA